MWLTFLIHRFLCLVTGNYVDSNSKFAIKTVFFYFLVKNEMNMQNGDLSYFIIFPT